MSIAEVAKRAGVSRATVSRVINKRNGVSAEIAQAVRDAVAALGYQPPPLDRRPGRRAPLVSREGPGLIAVVVVDDLYQHTPGVFAAHLSGIEREAAEHGLGVLVVAPFTQWLISQAGWQVAFLALGGMFVFGVAPLNALLQRGRPEELGLLPDGARAVEPTATASRQPQPAPTSPTPMK